MRNEAAYGERAVTGVRYGERLVAEMVDADFAEVAGVRNREH